MTEKNKEEDPWDRKPTKEELEKWEKRAKAVMGTQGSKKLLNYFTEITRTIPFQNKIKDLRKTYDIPINGFVDEKHTVPPEKWSHRFTNSDTKLREEIWEICKNYSLHPLFWGDYVRGILFYNEIHQMADDGYDLCMFTDLQNEAEEPFGKSIQDADNFSFPLAVRISPYASKRDILNYIEAVYIHIIKPGQDIYLEKNVKIGKIKNKKESIQKRNNFIFENRHLPRKEIRHLLAEQKIYIDDGHIGKIVSLEMKKRKEL